MDTLTTYEAARDNPQKRKRFIQGLFDSIVPTYDLLNHVLSMGTDTRWRRDMVRCLGYIQGRRVIDLCCGTGDVSRLLSSRGAKTVSLDFSLEMVQHGIKKGALTCDPIVGDASVLPFGRETFDAAAIAFGIRNIPDLDHFMAEVHRVLRPEGQLAILELTRPENRLVRAVHSFYLRKLLPFIGGAVSRRRLAYRYLSGTIATFVHPLAIENMLQEHGFVSVRRYPKTLGAATIFTCRKDALRDSPE